MATTSKNIQTLTNYETLQKSTWAHRAWLACGCTTLLITLAKSISLSTSTSLLHSTLAAVIAYFAADLSSGLYHWAVDNYGSPQTPFFGYQIEAFLLHHKQPRAITKIPLATHLFIVAAAVTFIVTPVNLLSSDPVVLAFVFVYAGVSMFSLRIHGWAHTPRRKLPSLVVALQDVGVLLSQAQHAPHHQPPYNRNYCSVSGVWDRLLDWSGFFVMLELVVFWVVGLQPRSWGNLGFD